MSSNYPKDVKQSVINLVKKGKISQNIGEKFSTGADRQAQIPDMEELDYDPVFTFILIDKSGSMWKCVDAVLKGYTEMLDALRGSAITRNRAHYVCPYMFDTEVRKLHGPEMLSTKPGRDNVAVLTEDIYRPSGETALYKTLYYALQDMLALYNACREEGTSPKFSISLISDGVDNIGGVDPADIRSLISELRKGVLKSSVVVGLLNDSFDIKKLNELREKIGFEEMLDCSQADPREIRRKFIMASQSSVARTQR